MEQALKPDVLIQFIKGFFSVYIQVAKIKTALTWLHISLMNSSDYCIQANPCLACTFVLCSELRPVFSRTRWNTVSSQVDTIVGLLATLTIFSAIKTENRFRILWINSQFLNSLWCLCHCLSLVSNVKHEANIFGHSADYHHNPLSGTLLLAQAQSQPVCSSICQYAAWRFVGHHQVSLARRSLGVASTTLHFSSLFSSQLSLYFFLGSSTVQRDQ